jgi:hypothetical protein
VLFVEGEDIHFKSVSLMIHLIAARLNDIYTLISAVCKKSFKDCGYKTIVLSRPIFIHIFELAETFWVKWNNDFI